MYEFNGIKEKEKESYLTYNRTFLGEKRSLALKKVTFSSCLVIYKWFSYTTIS